MFKQQKDNKYFYLIIAVVCLSIFLFLFTFGFYPSKISGHYQPFTAADFSLVLGSDDFSGDTLQSRHFNQHLNKSSIILNPLSVESAQSLLPFAQEVYLHLFDKEDSPSNLSATTSWMFDQPLNFGTYIPDNSFARIIYQSDSGFLSFVLLGSTLTVNDDEIVLSDIILYQIDNVARNSLIKLGDRIINLAEYQNNQTIRINDLEKMELIEFSPINNNLLALNNHSFEQGLWQSEVGNCSAYLPGEPNLGMSLESLASDGQLALRLVSNNHFACTFNSFKVRMDSNNLYLLAVDYWPIKGSKIQVYYNIKNDLGRNQEKSILLKTDSIEEWQSLNKVIVPEIISPELFELYLYAPSDGSETIEVMYDNVRLIEYSAVRKLRPISGFGGKKILGQTVNLDQRSVFSIKQPVINLLENHNYSFEQGLWQSEVNDCSDYLKGDPQIDMKLNSDASLGENALELSSKNHYACTFKTFPVFLSADIRYELLLDYKNISGNNVQYYLNASSGNFIQEYFGNFDAINDYWNTAKMSIDLKDADAASIDLYLYAPSDGTRPVINLFDNIRVFPGNFKNALNYFLFIKDGSKKLGDLAAIEYKPINGSRTKVILHGVDGPILLIYPKNYSPKTSMSYLPIAGELITADQLGVLNDYYFSAEDKNGIVGRDELESLLASGMISAVGEKKIIRQGENIFHNDNLSDIYWIDWLKRKRIIQPHVSVTQSGYHAWLIDPELVCRLDDYCIRHQDGSFSLVILIESNFYSTIFGIKIFLLIMMAINLVVYLLIGSRKNQG